MQKSKPVLLPLTPGLMMSAMMRYDHAILMSSSTFLNITIEPIAIRVARAISIVILIYEAASRGEIIDAQVCEEFFGEGFYSIASEGNYTRYLDNYPDVMSLIVEAIEECA
jgi:hypothetical protein